MLEIKGPIYHILYNLLFNMNKNIINVLCILLSLVACDDRQPSFPIIIPGPQGNQSAADWYKNITEQRVSGVWKDLAVNETNKRK